MQTELEAGHDAEVAATTADRPEEIGVRVFIHVQELPIRGDDLSSQQAINGQAAFAYKIANAATKRDPANPHGTSVTKSDSKPVSADRIGKFARGQTGLCPGGLILNIDLQSLHG